MLSPELARSFFIVLAALMIFNSLRPTKRRLPPSPLLLFGCYVGFVFVIFLIAALHAIVIPIYVNPENGAVIRGAPVRTILLSFFGSRAEMFFLALATTALTLHQFLFTWSPSLKGQSGSSDPQPSMDRVLLVIPFFWLAIGALALSDYILPDQIQKYIQFAFLPVQALILLCFVPFQGGRHYDLIGLLIVWAASILVAIYLVSAKIAFFFIVGAVCFYFTARPPKPSQLLASLLIVITVLLAGGLIVESTRASWSNQIFQQDFFSKAMFLFTHKFFARQAETGLCMDIVIEAHADDFFNIGKHLDQLSILIPRALWPDKPNFSFGQEYAPKYCAIPNPATQQSSAITVLGNPTISGGTTGLAIASAVILSILGGLSLLAKYGTPLTIRSVYALTPWWIDFEQDYALYLGNLAKAGLIVLAISILLAWMIKGLART